MRIKKHHKVAAAVAIGGMAMISNAMASDAGWDGSYGGPNRNDGGSLQRTIALLREKV